MSVLGLIGPGVFEPLKYRPQTWHSGLEWSAMEVSATLHNLCEFTH